MYCVVILSKLHSLPAYPEPGDLFLLLGCPRPLSSRTQSWAEHSKACPAQSWAEHTKACPAQSWAEHTKACQAAVTRGSAVTSIHPPGGLPGGSAGKESAYSAGDLSSVPWLGRSPGGGHGNLLQYSWASLVAQLVKNPPAMWETWFDF